MSTCLTQAVRTGTPEHLYVISIQGLYVYLSAWRPDFYDVSNTTVMADIVVFWAS